MTRKLYVTDASYHSALQELASRVARGVKLRAEDSDMTGDKYTFCNLGLCAKDFGEVKDGVYWEKRHKCPHDARHFTSQGEPILSDPDSHDNAQGCFYKCRIFRLGSKPAHINQRVLTVAKAVGEHQ